MPTESQHAFIVIFHFLSQFCSEFIFVALLYWSSQTHSSYFTSFILCFIVIVWEKREPISINAALYVITNHHHLGHFFSLEFLHSEYSSVVLLSMYSLGLYACYK